MSDMNYDPKIHMSFAAYILKCLSKTCSADPTRYNLGDTQDSGAILSAVIFPLFLDKTDINYHVDAMTTALLLGCGGNLLEEFKELTKTCKSPPDFVFVQVKRDVFPVAHNCQGPIPYQLSLEAFTSITLSIRTNSHAFILEGFIVFSGRIDDGHYISYVREKENFLCTSAHGRTLIAEDVFLRAAQNSSTTLLYMQVSEKDRLERDTIPKRPLPSDDSDNQNPVPNRQDVTEITKGTGKGKMIHVKKSDNKPSNHDDYYPVDDGSQPPKKPKHSVNVETFSFPPKDLDPIWIAAKSSMYRTFDMTYNERTRLTTPSGWFNDVIIDNCCC